MAKQVEKRPTSVIEVPVEKILADDTWNCRSGRSDGSKEEECEQDELKESIREVGQEQACLVKPGPDGTYVLTTGFRRYYAIKALAEEARKSLPVKVIVQDMSAREAAEANARENIARQDLNAPDTCFAVGRARDAEKDEGSYKNDSQLARTLGLKQSWVARLLKCWDGLHPDVFKHWRSEALIKLPIATMNDLAVNTPKDEQMALYTKLYKTRERATKARAPSTQRTATEKAESKAKKLGETIGILEAMGQVQRPGDGYDFAEICERLIFPDLFEGNNEENIPSNRKKVVEELSNAHARAFRDYETVLAKQHEESKAERQREKDKANRKVVAVA
jgi:ParB/RepB/Spo0J family partition protein